MNGIIYEQKKKRGYMGADTSEKNTRRVNTKRDGSVYDCYTLQLYHVAVVCTTARLFKCSP